MDWISIIVSAVCATIGALSGAGILFYRQTKRTKEAEANKAEIEVTKNQSDEWQELYYEQRDRVKEAREECMRLRLLKEESTNKANKLELENQQLEWFRCTVNNCKMRKPPHVFDSDGNELESIV